MEKKNIFGFFYVWIIILFLLIISGCDQNPFKQGSVWTGEYVCSQGKTELELKIIEVNDNAVKATFNFNHEASGNVGSFYMLGEYNKDNHKMLF